MLQKTPIHFSFSKTPLQLSLLFYSHFSCSSFSRPPQNLFPPWLCQQWLAASCEMFDCGFRAVVPQEPHDSDGEPLLDRHLRRGAGQKVGTQAGSTAETPPANLVQIRDLSCVVQNKRSIQLVKNGNFFKAFCKKKPFFQSRLIK